MKTLEKVSPNVEDLRAELGKAKEGVGQISKWADELYKQGVPVEKIKDLLEQVGLRAVKEEAKETPSHEEL